MLLRGINVGGHKKVPMAELRRLATQLGVDEPETYIASGNLLGAVRSAPEATEAAFEQAIESHFGFPVSVIARTAERWLELAEASAFPDAEVEREKLLHLGLSKRPPSPDAAERLEAALQGGERIRLIDDGLWVDFATGVGRSKLTPTLLDRTVGSPVTARNWRSVQKIAELVRRRL